MNYFVFHVQYGLIKKVYFLFRLFFYYYLLAFTIFFTFLNTLSNTAHIDIFIFVLFDLVRYVHFYCSIVKAKNVDFIGKGMNIHFFLGGERGGMDYAAKNGLKIFSITK